MPNSFPPMSPSAVLASARGVFSSGACHFWCYIPILDTLDTASRRLPLPVEKFCGLAVAGVARYETCSNTPHDGRMAVMHSPATWTTD